VATENGNPCHAFVSVASSFWEVTIRKFRLVILSFAVCTFAVSAQANSVPIFNVNQGTALVTPSPFVIRNLGFGFSGSGFSFNGNGTVMGGCGFCVSNAPPGFSGLTGSNEITSSGPNIGQVTLGTAVLDNVFFHGVVSITGSKTFSLPSGNQPFFTITLPVTFSGQLLACPAGED
jgi:hypothetical protein